MGRRGTMEVMVGIRDGAAEKIRIAGNAVVVFRTEMEI